jgi:hypothetical protein
VITIFISGVVSTPPLKKESLFDVSVDSLVFGELSDDGADDGADDVGFVRPDPAVVPQPARRTTMHPYPTANLRPDLI